MVGHFWQIKSSLNLPPKWHQAWRGYKLLLYSEHPFLKALACTAVFSVSFRPNGKDARQAQGRNDLKETDTMLRRL